jgi:hypothetical protein
VCTCLVARARVCAALDCPAHIVHARAHFFRSLLRDCTHTCRFSRIRLLRLEALAAAVSACCGQGFRFSYNEKSDKLQWTALTGRMVRILIEGLGAKLDTRILLEESRVKRVCGYARSSLGMSLRMAPLLALQRNVKMRTLLLTLSTRSLM